MIKVYVTNLSSHDFSAAERYGELIFISQGSTPKYNVNSMFRQWTDILADSRPDDYILPTGLTVSCMVGAAVFARKHGTLNLLLFKDGHYISRKCKLDELLQMENGKEVKGVDR